MLLAGSQLHPRSLCFGSVLPSCETIITTLINKNSSQRQSSISMNSRCAKLPNLNSYFNFMQAYQRHRKRIQEIRKSPSLIKSRIKIAGEKMLGQEGNGEKDNSPSPGKQKDKREVKHRLSPRANRNQYEIRKENNRMIQRIRKCHSTINRKSIQKHSQESRKMKDLLSRFIYSQKSHKVILRCRQSLQLMKSRQLKSQNESKPISRNPSRVRHAKSEASRMETHGSSNQNNSNSTSKQSIINKFSLPKQEDKAEKRLQRSKIAADSKDFESLKFNFWNKSNRRMKTDIRRPQSIFFTQLQS